MSSSLDQDRAPRMPWPLSRPPAGASRLLGRFRLAQAWLLAVWFGGSASALAQPAAVAPPAAGAAAAATPAPPPAVAAQPAPEGSGAPIDAAAPPASEAETPGTQAVRTPGLLGREELEQRLANLDKSGLEPALQERVGEALRRALELAVSQQQVQAKLEQNKQRLENLPQRVEERRAALAAPLPSLDLPPRGAGAAELESRRFEREKTFAEKQQAQTALKAEPKDRSLRLTQIPEEEAQAQRQLRETDEALEDLPAAETDSIEVGSERQRLLQQQRYLTTLLASLDAEEQYFKAGGEALQLLLDLRSRELTALEQQLAAWRDALKLSRQSEAGAHKQQAEAAAREAAAQQSPLLQKLADTNVELADQSRLAAAQLAKATDERAALKAQAAALRAEYDEIRKRVEAAGMSAESGALLREKQSELPDARAVRRRSADRQESESVALFRQFDYSDQRLALPDIEQAVQETVREAGGAVKPEEVRTLLESRRELLDRLVKYYEDYATVLHELEVAEADLLTTTEQYRDFIAQRVLWIRSCDPPRRTHVRAALDAAAWAFSPANWRQAGITFATTLRARPAETALWACGLFLLAVLQRRLRESLRACGEQASKRTCSQFKPTLQALWQTFVIALLWPGVLYAAGRFLDNPQEPSEFVRALSVALKFCAFVLWGVESIRQLCRNGGLAAAHFDWSAGALVQIRRIARWLNALGLPLASLVVGLEVQKDPQDFAALWSPSLGRLAFVVLMLLMAWLLYRLLVATGSPYRKLLLARAASGSLPLQRFWRPLLALAPLALAGLAGTGYYYTAQQGALRLCEGLLMLGGVAVLGDLVRRWLLVSQRGLKREQARQRRAQLLAAQEAEGQSAPLPEMPEETIDLAALGEQTLKLVGVFLSIVAVVGLFVILQRLLPALQFIGSLPILPAIGALTWGQALLFALAVYFTYVGARDLPALVELTLLKRLPFDPAARYALTSVSRYLLIAAGVTTAFSAIGIAWGQVQWLIAAMGVGLGFGLQEIFANFVSGVILLFEQPIRVGDVVTIGDKTGQVNRIRIRATTLVDWDRKEYVIPNKDLVTGSLLNWTLTDQTNRVVINVGVAYGSDTELACRLLLEAAREQPAVLEEPEPVATFDGFGDSALNLVLRCYLPNLDNRLATIHALHTDIHGKFAAAGLEIPFPQRDLHIRSIPRGLERPPTT